MNGVGIEFRAGRMAKGGVDHDPVALEARDHVQVNVEDVLAGRSTFASLQQAASLCQSLLDSQQPFEPPAEAVRLAAAQKERRGNRLASPFLLKLLSDDL